MRAAFSQKPFENRAMAAQPHFGLENFTKLHPADCAYNITLYVKIENLLTFCVLESMLNDKKRGKALYPMKKTDISSVVRERKKGCYGKRRWRPHL